MQKFTQPLVAIFLVFAITSVGSAAEQDSAAHKLHILNQGYSLLYQGVSGASNADKLLLVKFENDATDKVVTQTSDYLAKLADQLKQLAKDYPGIRLDLHPLPAIEREKQAAANKARIEGLAPVVGRTGPDFERTLLFTLSGGLNQFRHLARVMAAAERNDQRRTFLKHAEHRMDKLYDDMQRVLNQYYFVHNTYEPPAN